MTQAENSPIRFIGLDVHKHYLICSQRYSYLRQFAPALIKAVDLQNDTDVESPVIKAAALLRKMNEDGVRKLPEDAPLEFMPKKKRELIEKTALLTKGIGNAPC